MGGTGGVTILTPTGGTTPYTYLWNPVAVTTQNVNGLSAGTYTLTVADFGGCSSSATVTITQPSTALSSITITSQTNIACYGGTGSLSASATSGGTAPYTYSWSGGAGSNLSVSNLAPGTYTLTATDNHGCIVSAVGIITQPALPLTASLSSVTNVACNGANTGVATVNISSHVITSYSYEAAVQHYTVPSGITTVTVSVSGAQGGSDGGTGGAGASFSGLTTVTPGEILSIAVGQQGVNSTNADAGGGGGATWVYDSLSNSLFTAAAGGGGGGNSGGAGATGGTDLTGNTTTASNSSATGGTLGTGGAGGTSTRGGGGGAGWTTNGTSVTGTSTAQGRK